MGTRKGIKLVLSKMAENNLCLTVKDIELYTVLRNYFQGSW